MEGGLAPRALWEGLFDEAVLTRAGGAGEEDAARRAARRYKDWLMYYKVVAAAPDAGGGAENGGTTKSIDHEGMNTASGSRFGSHDGFAELKDFLSIADQDFQEDTKGSSDSRCLHEMLEESQSDSPVSLYSHLDSSEESDSEAAPYDKGRSAKIMSIDTDFLSAKLHERISAISVNDSKMKPNCLQSNRSHGSLNNLSNSVLELKSAGSYSTSNYSAKDGMFPQCSPRCDLRCFSNFSTKFIKKSSLSDLVSRGSMSRKFKTSTTSEDWSDVSSRWGKDGQVDFLERFEKAVSKLLVSDGLDSCLDAGSEVTTIWQLLNNTYEVRHRSSVRQDILDQLLDSISTSKKDKVIRASVYVLLLMISEDRNMMRGIKRKDFHLSNLATALKRDVHEAAILIYLLDPTPLEIKNLDLLPSLLHIACNSDTQKWPAMLPLTPTSASIALIEILVTAFDYITNNVHLASLSSPPILSKLVDVAKNNNLEEVIHDAGYRNNHMEHKSARAIIKIGIPFIRALAKGMQSKVKGTSHDCLVCTAWLGSELAALGDIAIRYSACEILLHDIASHLHPGLELDERVLACMCLYNYTSGKGKQMLMSLSEGSRESLRRLSSFTWMAEELLQVTDYFLSSKPRVSCVHTQILEIGQPGNGTATAISFFRGQLFAGYSNGTIRAWDIKGQRAIIIREVKEHKKAVTCFALSETGENLLSGSADKSIRVWEMAQHKLECVEVIQTREGVQKLDICGDKILVLTQNNVLKFSCASRSSQTLYRGKHIKCLAVCQGKAYLGCTDLSIQELDMSVESKIEIRAPNRSWRIRKKSISAIVVYKDWMYCAGAQVEGSALKDWKKRCRPSMTLPIPKGTSVEAMAVVEDFIYLNCSKSPSIIQIWLREKQQKVGRLSAGSKITSLFAANNMTFCGTETGLIKVSSKQTNLEKRHVCFSEYKTSFKCNCRPGFHCED
ncbi:hypothetical protein C2845_PM06G24080 [Panicum miliaceum]|uniref:Uncharacterized protein n=1 Tax=Panicum miliaceum TaxID=4540 RepID=A0A3L6RCC3_PANMI|nr:hypothetical protein C2845_PM06G24080 [Panicum miliaceum]